MLSRCEQGRRILRPGFYVEEMMVQAGFYGDAISRFSGSAEGLVHDIPPVPPDLPVLVIPAGASSIRMYVQSPMENLPRFCTPIFPLDSATVTESF
jgi:hypothetical protein